MMEPKKVDLRFVGGMSIIAGLVMAIFGHIEAGLGGALGGVGLLVFMHRKGPNA
jgi:hypothetical protein